MLHASCPMHANSGSPLSCNGEQVTVVFHRGQAHFAACSSLVRQGWRGPTQLVTSATGADRYMPEASAPVQHIDGLVTFG